MWEDSQVGQEERNSVMYEFNSSESRIYTSAPHTLQFAEVNRALHAPNFIGPEGSKRNRKEYNVKKCGESGEISWETVAS